MRVRIVFITLCLVCLVFGAWQSDAGKTPINKEPVDKDTEKSFVSWIPMWPDDIEVAYFIPFDGKGAIKVTSNLPDRVYYKPSIPEILAEYGYKLKDIHVFIHNHLTDARFSPEDVTAFWYVAAHGFRGAYLLKNTERTFYLVSDLEKEGIKEPIAERK